MPIPLPAAFAAAQTLMSLIAAGMEAGGEPISDEAMDGALDDLARSDAGLEGAIARRRAREAAAPPPKLRRVRFTTRASISRRAFMTVPD